MGLFHICIYHMTVMLISEITHVINNDLTTCVLTPAQLLIGYHNQTHHYSSYNACL